MFIDSYVLDTLQIYFPWDDDLYTHLKNKGLMKLNPSLKALPLIYSDNTISTRGESKIKRNYIINPTSFNETTETLGWDFEDNKYIIPAEKPQLQIELDDDTLKLTVMPTVKDKEEYHLEYSIRSAFGKLFSNWVTFYFSLNEFKQLISELQKNIKIQPSFNGVPEMKIEKKQEQREQMHWTYIPLKEYRFSLGDFKYLSNYLENSGVVGVLPGLEYNVKNIQLKSIMNPFVKLGYIETKENHGFWTRKPQIVIKLAQDKTIVGQRGKKIRMKGKIKDALSGSYVKIGTKEFVEGALKVLKSFELSNINSSKNL
jgi:hypothetical protein